MNKPTAAPWRIELGYIQADWQETGGYAIARIERTHRHLSTETQEANLALIVAACNAIQRLAAALDCDPVQLAEHLATAHPGAMLDKLASVFGEEE